MRILSLYSRRGDSTSFYRGVLPINELCKLDRSIEIVEREKLSWADLANIDLVFYQRPHTENAQQVIEICKNNNKKVVIDHDDLLSSVPKANPFHLANKDVDYKKMYKDIIQSVDGFILSTDYMLNSLNEFRYIKPETKTCVVNNGFNDYLFKLENKFSNYNKSILWRGSNTHNVDFEPYKNDLLKLIKDNQDFTFIFIGFIPFKEMSKMQNVIYKETMDPIYYMKAIRDLEPSLGFYPLLDIPFNHAKSNIYKIEMTYAGAVVMNPQGEEWKWNSKEEFFINKKTFLNKTNIVMDMIRNKDERIKEEYDNNYQYLKDNYLLSNLNKQRLEFFRSFIDG